jgi:hypothetical protein
MISERTLRNWRRDSLKKREYPLVVRNGDEVNVACVENSELHERVLRLTQELLDQHLLRKD